MTSKKLRGRRPEAEPWAILPSALHRILAWDRGEVTLEAVQGELGPTTGAPPRSRGAIAVIPVTGVIEHHSDWMMELLGGTAVDSLAADFRAAMSDPDVRAVVLDIDSPGGTVSGVQELASTIREARGGDKPVVAVANAMAASAAYWLASQADEVVVTPSAQVGSIGVYSMHQDISGALEQEGVRVTLVSAGPHKTEGNMFEPLSEEGRADLQARVDETYRQFVGDVAAGRRVSADQVRADFGGGRVMTARAAVKAGMADRVETLDATLARLSRGRPRAPAARAELEPGRLLVELPSVTVTNGTTNGASTSLTFLAVPDVEAATWSAAYINDLPDSAFACVDAGGEKDADGKTTPRSLRHYPHHDASGKVDEEHLRAARSRVSQDATTSCGRDHLFETHSLPADEASAASLADELTAAAAELGDLVERATTRAGLRRSEGRPAYTTKNERSLRTIRDAIDALLEPDDPAASGDPAADDPPPAAPPSAADDPPQVAPVKPPPAAPPRAFRSREEWLQYVRTH